MLATVKGFYKLHHSNNTSASNVPGPLRLLARKPGAGVLYAVLMVCCLSVSAVAAQGASLSSPCNSSRLDQMALSDLPTPSKALSFSLRTVSAFYGSDSKQAGCFSQWLPLPHDAVIQPEVLEAIQDIKQNLSQEVVSPPIFNGLMERLGAAMDQDEFEPVGNTPGKGFSFGNIASLETKHEAILAFLEQVANNLIPSSSTGETQPRNVGFTLNLNNIPLSASTLIGGSSVFTVDEYLNVFLEDLTITLSNGTLTGETQLNPESLAFERGAFSIDLNIGNARVRSTTTFEKDQGVTKQVLNMTAGLGQLSLHSQVTLSLNSSEFRLGASISDLAITTISTVDTFGNQRQTVELEINF